MNETTNEHTSTQASTREKLRALQELLRSYGSLAIAFSGGVDSTFLAAVAERIMPDRALLVHLTTPLVGTPEQQSFLRATARQASETPEGEPAVAATGAHPTLSLPVLEIKLNPLANPDVVRNDELRCYHCKHAGFSRIAQEARTRGYAEVLDGSNADDALDFRPGMRAIEELGVRSPLMETGWHKQEERDLLRAWGHPVWDMPSGACLATRVAQLEPLSGAKLEAIRACEDYLRSQGLRQVRARLAAGAMRIEASAEDLERLGAEHGEGVPLPDSILAALRERLDVSLDPIAHPYRKGDMNKGGAKGRA